MNNMKMNQLRGVGIALLLGGIGLTSCTKKEPLSGSNSNPNSNDKWATFMEAEVVKLSKLPVVVTKDITEGEKVERQNVTLKSKAEWEEELKGFLNFQTLKELEKSKSKETIDSNGMYHISRSAASDTNAYLQEFTVWKVKNEVQILTWKYKTRSLLMDRNVEMSYQPMKGYRLQIWENSFWSSPKQIEIFATFESN
jgi:hypothetical protein